jgi:hypothetical protein
MLFILRDVSAGRAEQRGDCVQVNAEVKPAEIPVISFRPETPRASQF